MPPAAIPESESSMREWHAELLLSHTEICTRHRALFDRYRRLPEALRENSSAKFYEKHRMRDPGDLPSSRTYADTLWSGLLEMLGEKLARQGVASSAELQVVEEFVERCEEDVARAEEVVGELESLVEWRDDGG